MSEPITAVSLATRIHTLPGVGHARAKRLAKLGLLTARDVLFFFPRDYEFPAPPADVDQLREGQSASLVGTITDAEVVSRTAGKSVFGALVENDSGAVRLLFFNQPFRAEQLRVNQRVLISGNPKLNGLRWEFVHPKVTIFGRGEDLPKPVILPVYSLTDGVKQTELRQLTRQVCEMLADSLTEVMPESLRQTATSQLRDAGVNLSQPLMEIRSAIRQIHRPDDKHALQVARTRFVFQELFVLQLALAMRRRKLTTDLLAPPLPTSAMIEARILNRFPFEPTDDQRRVMNEIATDLGRQFPMNRLLQGDVGSGKTVVAIFAMMICVAGGYQAVLMAPTEVLARQHHRTLSRTLADSRVRVGLLCGSLTAAQRREVIEATASGEIAILVGTQSLLSETVEFKKLGLVVIDEQHKFGVSQRVTLRGGGVDPHYLVMSATPIPRSIAMTVFGDVELSVLREKPPGRGEVHTYLAHDGWKDRWWAFVRERLDEGRQAFVVAPRVATSGEDEDTEDVSSVESVHHELAGDRLRDYDVGLLHGRMSVDEKQSVMQAFASGRLQVLVSTTVIEVGIDVPNATVMTILGSQRFGLAQLHQLRGRVSRGKHAGHVCVFTDGELPPEENERLRIFEQTSDGFELAEADFRMRGPGDLMGQKQSGIPPMRIADLVNDVEILSVARQIAQTMIDAEPDLGSPQLRELRSQVMRRYGKRLNVGDVA